ncbi:MAG: TonB-dependent receptor [Alphaproteobacteria bacterium]|nr:MAG: TonB-dependent receptor [Alphaproteobacteria bacterium]
MKIIIHSALAGAVIFLPTTALYADEQQGQPHDHGHVMEELFVTGSPHGKTRLDVLQGSSQLGLDELEQRMEATIGETLSGIPGISSSFFGPGASRPIIRGLGGDRIRILINGIGSIDASSTSPDHSVAADPLTAERIEVLRGASTLLYGSNAVGGVVNIIDGRIPSVIPDAPFSGRARLGYGTSAYDISGGMAINAQLSGSSDRALLLHLDGYFRKSSDYTIPGFAKSDRLRAPGDDGPYGTVENSDLDNKGGAIGLSWVGEQGMFGLSYSLNDSNYGVPGSQEEEVVRIDLDQKRFDLKGNLTHDVLIFEETRLRFGYGDYAHKELEGGEIGTIFNNEGWEGRLELIQREIGNIHGSMGLQIRKRDFEAIGAEAFVPPTTTLQWGLFAVEEISLDPVTLEFGARLDHQTTENKSLNQKRTFTNISLSAGAAIHPTANSLIGLSLGRTERAPTAEELFSNGPHLATSAFEKGNVNLSKETATSLELTLKQDSERFSASFNLYHTWFGGFISEQFTGLQIEGLNILEFGQRDARFYGAELDSSYLLITEGEHDLWLKLSGDIVRAKFTGPEDFLPRIPAQSATLALDYQGPYLGATATVRRVADQTRLAENETPTEGYTELNLDILWHPFGEARDLTVHLQGKNLSNTERRQHTSFLKDLLPMPGRNIKLSVTYGF